MTALGSASPAPSGAAPPTPLTVVGGFLGAGKTTLLNRLLADPDAPRCAVLVNDFGAVDIDASLIRDHDGRTLTLANGCVCCSLASGFAMTMLTVTAERHRFDHVVVEASGVAEPERIMDIARLDPELVPNAVVTVIDAAELLARLDDAATGDLVAVQLDAADLVVVNKIDRVAPTTLEAVVDVVRRRNPRAGVVRTSEADVPLAVVLGATRRSADGGPMPSPRRAHVAADRFHTATLRGTSAIARDALTRLDASLDANVVRAKGIVALDGEPGRWSWQRVGGGSRVERLDGEGPAGEPFVAVLIATAPIVPAALALPDGVTVAS